jgi:hypothetical protein
MCLLSTPFGRTSLLVADELRSPIVGPDEYAASAMQTMTTLFQDRAAAFGNGDVEDTREHQAAKNVYNIVRDLLSKTKDGRGAFNQFRLHPHEPHIREQFQATLAAVLRVGLEESTRKAIEWAIRPQKTRHTVGLIVKAATLATFGIVFVVASVLPIGTIDWIAAILPGGTWFGLGVAWSLVFGLGVKLVFMCIGIGLLAWCASAIQNARLERTHTSSRVIPVSSGAARRLQQDAGTSKVVNALQAKVFASAVLWPTDVRQRIVETYIPERNTIRKRVRIEVQLPVTSFRHNKVGVAAALHGNSPTPAHQPVCALAATDATSSAAASMGSEGCGLTRLLEDDQDRRDGLPEDLKTIYFPVLIPRKGALHDNFDVLAADGTIVPVLAYREYLQLAAGTLRLLLTPNGNADVRKAELRALEEISQRRLKLGDPVPQRSTPSGHEQIRAAISGDTQAAIAADFAEKLREHYAVVAVVQPDARGRFVITYEQTIIPDAPYERLAAALGARPLDLVVDLDNASTCQSYHLRVECPDSLYLRRQTLKASQETLQRIQLDAPTVAHTRFQKRLGQAYAHFYARFFPVNAPGHPAPKIKFTFCEVPPASVFRASIAAVACFLLVWAVGVVISRQPDPGTDAPAFLLAFPAVAAALLGFDRKSHSLLESTLHARLSLIVTALLSILASALFMAHKALSETKADNKPPSGGWVDWPKILTEADGVPILGVTSWLWIVLILVGLLNAGLTVCAYIVRLATFGYLQTRNSSNVVRR